MIKNVGIACPRHGILMPPYLITTIHTGKLEIRNVSCGYCANCDRYYTTAMAIAIGEANPINGKLVRRGRPQAFDEKIYERLKEEYTIIKPELIVYKKHLKKTKYENHTANKQKTESEPSTLKSKVDTPQEIQNAISIACPKHGKLNPPTRTTTIEQTGKIVYVNCSYCSACDVFYTVPKAIVKGNPKPINGKKVRRGLVIGKIPKTQIQTGFAKVGMIGTGKHAEADSTEAQAASIKVFSVTDRIEGKESAVCPICRSRIYRKQYNVPVYQSDDTFYAYFASWLYLCHSCNKYYMKQSDFNALNRKITGRKNRLLLKPQNMRASKSPYTDAYLYAPTVDTDFFRINVRERERLRRESAGFMGMLNSASFLTNLGYSVSVSAARRREILNTAIQMYGQRKVADHLRFLISTRAAQKNDRFENAVAIWEEDIDYVVSHKPRY